MEQRDQRLCTNIAENISSSDCSPSWGKSSMLCLHRWDSTRSLPELVVVQSNPRARPRTAQRKSPMKCLIGSVRPVWQARESQFRLFPRHVLLSTDPSSWPDCVELEIESVDNGTMVQLMQKGPDVFSDHRLDDHLSAIHLFLAKLRGQQLTGEQDVSENETHGRRAPFRRGSALRLSLRSTAQK